MRLTLLTAVGLALVTNLIPVWKPRLDIANAKPGGTSGGTPPPPAETQPAENPLPK